MAKFTPNEMDLSQINGGNQFVNGDIVEADTLNKVIEGVAYAQENGGGGGGSSVDIVQSTGSSTTSVMSQKATSEELYKRVTNVDWDSDGKLHFTYETAGGGLRVITYTPPSGGGSTTLYQHFVCCDIGSQGALFFTIFNVDPTPFNSSSIWNHMPSEVGKAIPVSGYYDTGVAFKIAYEEEYQDSYMTMIYYTSSSGGYTVSGLYDLGTVTDTVTEMK